MYIYCVLVSIKGKNHSVGLLIGSFIGGCVDCLTSLLFYPFVAQFPSYFTVYIYIYISLCMCEIDGEK
jgi:hypothetical protein